MHGLQACLFKYITVAAFHIYAQCGKMPLKGEVGGHVHYIVMEITLLIMENHGIVFLGTWSWMLLICKACNIVQVLPCRDYFRGRL